MYEKIITHNDFDGLASAAICSYVLQIENIQFAGPNTITSAQISISEQDIVCDLPYPLTCGLWFDHHAGNLEELKYRRIDPATIPGRFEALPSCTHVCFDYFKSSHALPAYFEQLVIEADIIDAFNYSSIEDWRRETPGKIIDAAIRAHLDDIKQKRQLLRQWILLLRAQPIHEVAATPSVQDSYQHYLNEEQEMLKLIEQNATFLEQDALQEIILLDFTQFNRRPVVIKNLAYLLFPRALAVLELNALFNRGVKTTNFGISMSLSLNLNGVAHQRDIGEILRELNLGDGHAGAAGGTVYCNSKNEMLKQKQHLLREIFRLWQKQR
ncbi:hypothetical protein L0128_19555 [candidate division KSB1 bacterium]|nr:hypothetical protein [candidate division KSB1 bacterium]